MPQLTHTDFDLNVANLDLRLFHLAFQCLRPLQRSNFPPTLLQQKQQSTCSNSKTPPLRSQRRLRHQVVSLNDTNKEQESSAYDYDTIIIGSGLGGLSTAALLTRHNRRTVTLEAHTQPGGAAHSFSRRTKHGTFHFESGPHLFSGLSTNIRNPMHSILLASGVKLPVKKYAKWGVIIKDQFYPTTVSKSTPFLHGLLNDKARQEVDDFLQAIEPLGELATSLPPAFIRPSDFIGSMRIMLPRLVRDGSKMLRILPQASYLSKPFAPLLNQYVSDKFARQFFNLLCFLLAGVDANKIPTAEIAFMLREWVPSSSFSAEKNQNNATNANDKDLVLEQPIGGAFAIAEALVKSIEDSRTGSLVRTNTRVTKVLIDEVSLKVKGVQLASGEIIRGQKVICNVSTLDLPKLFPDPWKSSLQSQANDLQMCQSFMHLHIAIPLSCIPQDHDEILPNYAVIADDLSDLEHPGNIVLVSVPSVLDPNVAPPGFALAHAYTPATEPYEPWSKLQERTEEYEQFKKERSKPLWNAVNRIFGVDVERHAIIKMVGTPKTHARFLNRSTGTYGPAVDASSGGFSLGLPWPAEGNGLPQGAFRVGDGVFPGVGVPAVAGSAWLVTNEIVSVKEQHILLEEIGL